VALPFRTSCLAPNLKKMIYVFKIIQNLEPRFKATVNMSPSPRYLSPINEVHHNPSLSWLSFPHPLGKKIYVHDLSVENPKTIQFLCLTHHIPIHHMVFMLLADSFPKELTYPLINSYKCAII
jgi:hypothetical protein